MKSKTKTYVLLTLVLGIWGVIGYKIMSAVNPKAPETSNNDFEVSFSPKLNTELESFNIQAVDRDPFLGNLYTKKKAVAKKLKPLDIVWMPITYHGCVTNKTGKNKVFVVSINNKQFLMKLGQTIDSVKLINGSSNGIKVNYKGIRKTIPKT
ncbi:hypothetical protein [Seonamhaeicola sp.]|uniref:hypothetical protein n=1 Tax=Seonamhaeicola sp. TaxID=1912245 RepID=UPI0026189C69|nr:hypothetical protein [Seonamhaeicola sp.]